VATARVRNARSRGNVCKRARARYKPARARDGVAMPDPPRPFASLFRAARLFLPTYNRRRWRSPPPPPPPPSSPRAIRARRCSWCRAARRRAGSYGTYGGRYVLWLIVLLSLTYFQFTAAARRFASWLSIVRDERRFICQPECPLRPTYPRTCLVPRWLSIALSELISAVSAA
jgi:hypothetical protein